MAVNPISDLPEHGHTHLLVPFDELERRDGLLQVWSRCVCGLEERRSYAVADGQARPARLEYRLGGSWMTALDLIRRRDLPVAECEACAGAGCLRCLGLGVTEAGGAVRYVRPARPSSPSAPGWYDATQDRIVPLDLEDRPDLEPDSPLDAV